MASTAKPSAPAHEADPGGSTYQSGRIDGRKEHSMKVRLASSALHEKRIWANLIKALAGFGMSILIALVLHFQRDGMDRDLRNCLFVLAGIGIGYAVVHLRRTDRHHEQRKRDELRVLNP